MEEMHRECAAALVRQVQPHQASRLQVRPHHGRRHVAPADAGEQQGMLGAEIAEAPPPVGEDAEILPLCEGRAVGEFALKGIRRPMAAYNVVAAIS